MHYLRGFTGTGQREILWVFERPSGRAFSTQPGNVAIENSFYPADVEAFLADAIEEPSNRILKSIREDHEFDPKSKAEFSRYIVAMIRRVPRHRERLYDEVLPDALDATMDGWRNLIRSERDEGRLDDQMYVHRMEEIDELEKRWKHELPEELKPENRPPELSGEVVDLLASMHWTFVIANGSSMFLTGDNPVFYTEGTGMNKPDSELMFPLSTQVALWVKRTPISSDCAFHRAKQFLVREANKRTIWNASRFVIYHEHAEWIPELIRKGSLTHQQLPARDTGLFKERRR